MIVAVAVALAALVLNALAALVGGWAWWQVRAAARVLDRCCARARPPRSRSPRSPASRPRSAHRPDDGLFWVYALLPVAVSFVAEQLRVGRHAELDARGIETAQAVGALPEPSRPARVARSCAARWGSWRSRRPRVLPGAARAGDGDWVSNT